MTWPGEHPASKTKTRFLPLRADYLGPMERVLITSTSHPDYNRTGVVVDQKLLDVPGRYVTATTVQIDGEDRTAVVLTGEFKQVR